MKKDIHVPKVEDIAVAIVEEESEEDKEWVVYLLNMKNCSIHDTLVSSKGYGEINQKKKKTTFFSHYLETLESQSFKKVEMINESVFGLTNEFFLTYYINGIIHDKKYIFLPETIIKENKTKIPLLNKKGIMIR
ncbi:MAG: hypothetical protein P8L23_04770 [Flavobacteriales bacterium]|nr:hypothetical protein [Flavobacteriales bacterium]